MGINLGSPTAEGNTNYGLLPNKINQFYQQGKVTVVVTEDITGVDQSWGVEALDFQFNYFMESGMWMQTILEPCLSPNTFRADEFQQWAVKPPYNTSNDYAYVERTLGSNWANGTLSKGSILELLWMTNAGVIMEWYCTIRLPNGVSDGWMLTPQQFPSDWVVGTDLMFNENSDVDVSVFSITGIGGGSVFKANSGAGKIGYSGLHPILDGAGNQQTALQTEESSNFKYSPLVADDFGNWVQTFGL